MALRPNLALLFVQIKFYWSTDMPVCLHIVVAAFVLQRQRRSVATQTLQPTKPKTCILWPFKEKAHFSALNQIPLHSF